MVATTCTFGKSMLLVLALAVFSKKGRQTLQYINANWNAQRSVCPKASEEKTAQGKLRHTVNKVTKSLSFRHNEP